MDTQYTEWLAAVRQQGLSDEDISNQLRAAGWTDVHITELLHPGTPPPPAAPVPPTPPIAMQSPEVAPQPTTAAFASTFAGPVALYRATFANFSTRFGYYIGYGAIAAGLILGLALAFGFLATQIMGEFFDFGYMNSSGKFIGFIAILLIAYFGFIVVTTIVTTWLWAVIGLTIMSPDGERSFFGIFQDALRRVPHMLWANLIVAYIIAGFSILGFTALGFGGAFLGFSGFLDMDFTFIFILGACFMFAVLVWVGTYLTYTPFVALVGNGRGVQAVRESQSIVHGMWWRTFGRLLAIIGPMFAVSIIMQILLLIIDLDTGIVNVILGVLFQLIGIMVLLPIFVTYVFGMYNTAANYRQRVMPTSSVSTMSMIIAATLGWVLVIGFLVLNFLRVREYVQPFDDYQSSYGDVMYDF